MLVQPRPRIQSYHSNIINGINSVYMNSRNIVPQHYGNSFQRNSRSKSLDFKNVYPNYLEKYSHPFDIIENSKYELQNPKEYCQNPLSQSNDHQRFPLNLENNKNKEGNNLSNIDDIINRCVKRTEDVLKTINKYQTKSKNIDFQNNILHSTYNQRNNDKSKINNTNDNLKFPRKLYRSNRPNDLNTTVLVQRYQPPNNQDSHDMILQNLDLNDKRQCKIRNSSIIVSNKKDLFKSNQKENINLQDQICNESNLKRKEANLILRFYNQRNIQNPSTIINRKSSIKIDEKNKNISTEELKYRIDNLFSKAIKRSKSLNSINQSSLKSEKSNISYKSILKDAFGEEKSISSLQSISQKSLKSNFEIENLPRNSILSLLNNKIKDLKVKKPLKITLPEKSAPPYNLTEKKFFNAKSNQENEINQNSKSEKDFLLNNQNIEVNGSVFDEMIIEFKSIIPTQKLFNDSKLHNTFKVELQKGYIYEGNQGENGFEGFGILYSSNSFQIYCGDWSNGLFHGQGKLCNAYCSQVIMKSDPLNLSQNLEWKMYEGEFSNGLPDGIGSIYYNDNSHFHGKFQKGKVYGEGGFSFDDGNICFGIWKDDILIQKF